MTREGKRLAITSKEIKRLFIVGERYTVQEFIESSPNYNLETANKRLLNILYCKPSGLEIEIEGKHSNTTFVITGHNAVSRVNRTKSPVKTSSIESYLKNVKPILQELTNEGRKNAATISISNVAYLAHKLKQFTKELSD